MDVISRVTDVSVDVLVSKNRFMHIARARHAVYYVMRDQGYSYPVIGKCLKRDHTTVMAGFKKARELVYTNAQFNLIIQTIQRSLHLAKELGMPAPASLQEFINRCAERCDIIKNTADEGMFAKQYNEDVTILLRLLQNKNESLDILYQRSV
jgi:hypothetical protein